MDPTPIAWTKPPRQDARSRNKSKEKEEKEAGVRGGGEEGGDDEGGPHRRKRGVLGCRRRVEFPGRAATCSTRCRELWRKHLQVRRNRRCLLRLVVSCGIDTASSLTRAVQRRASVCSSGSCARGGCKERRRFWLCDHEPREGCEASMTRQLLTTECSSSRPHPSFSVLMDPYGEWCACSWWK